MRSGVDLLRSQNSFLGFLYIYFLLCAENKLRKIPKLTSPSFQVFLSNYVTFNGRPRTFELFPVIGSLED
jgi:hypothetical protein